MTNEYNPLGIMSYVYLGHSAEQMATAIASHGLKRVQLDPRQAELRDGQGACTAAQARHIHRTFASAGINIDGLSGYINLLDPDLSKRAANVQQLMSLIRLCPEFGATWIATETGSLHPSNQWAYHPENATSEAWEQLLEVTGELQVCARQEGVTLLLEGYVNNVLHTSEGAKRLLDTLGREGLGLVFDPFNYLTADDLAHQDTALDRLFGDLIGDCQIAHAKDTIYTDKGIDTPRAGTGLADWPQIAHRLQQHAPQMPLYLEHLRPDEVEETIKFVRGCYE